ncbi:MAG: hypothetical protein AAF125_01015 [Chloroflexota bacterium]
MLKRVASFVDTLEHYWHTVIMERLAGSFLVVVYLAVIALVELNRQSLLPGPLANWLPGSHFFAVEVAFTILLMTEVVSLIFGLTRSFSRSMGIQLEILSLILLRDTFKKFTEFPEPLEWEPVVGQIMPMVGEAVGALAVFILIGFYYRIQQSQVITDDEAEQLSFIESKKLIALGLLGSLFVIGFVDLRRIANGLPPYPFFDSFYTVLIFTDILMVLLSLRFSVRYAVTFRNFGYAAVTVFIRVALIAPAGWNALIGIGAALFALAVASSYKAFGADIAELEEQDIHGLEEPGGHGLDSATAPAGD